MSTPKEKQVFLELIEMYKNLPILWDKEHKGYMSKLMRNDANKMLLEVYKKIDADATTQTLTRKILNLRTNYFEELRKVKHSLKYDAEVYEPTLWYFDAFTFLDDNNTSECRGSDDSCHSHHKDNIKIEDMSSLSSDEEESCQNSEIHSPVMRRRGSGRNSETHSSPPLKKRKFTNPVVYKNTNNSPELAAEPAQMKNEEWEIFGKAIGLQLRDLDKKQLTIAQKMISDTIYHAKFGLLSQKTYINLGSPPS